MPLRPAVLATVLLASAHPFPAGAAEVAASAGTLGAGAQLRFPLGDALAFRLEGHAWDHEDDRREAGHLTYDAEAHWRNAAAILDWHPGGRPFRVSGGVLFNGNEVEGVSVPDADGTYLIGRTRVPAALVGHLEATADFDSVAPYAGLGFAGGGGRVRVGLDLGAVFQGEPDTELVARVPADSPIHDVPGAIELLNQLVEEEERELEADAARYDIYPVVALSLGIRF
jgi:hypothetical protein